MKIPFDPVMSIVSYIQDCDVCSMYAWSPLVIPQSRIVRILKTIRSGKSHRVKMQAKKRLKLYRGAWIEYDTTEKREWTRKYISKFEAISNPTIEASVSFDFSSYNNE